MGETVLTPMPAICLLLIPVSFILSFCLSRSLIRVSPRRGHVDVPGREGHKGHARALPNTGGFAIFVAVAAPVMACLAAAWIVTVDFWGGWAAPLAEHIEGLRQSGWMGAGILAALLAMHVLGAIDDRRPLGTAPKLAVEVIVACVLALVFQIRIFEFLANFGPLGFIACIAASTLWLVAITNALNMLDNMDGLAGGVGGVIAVIYLAATLIGGQWFVAALCALLGGALGGFLCFNFPPAKLFMGDGGSLVVGLLLGVISMRTTYIAMPTTEAPNLWYGALMPLVVMAVPLYDLGSVVLIRLWSRRSPFAADHSHLSHRLVRRGLSPRAAVLVIWLATVATGLGGVMLSRLESWQAVIVACQTLSILAVLAALEFCTAHRE